MTDIFSYMSTLYESSIEQNKSSNEEISLRVPLLNFRGVLGPAFEL